MPGTLPTHSEATQADRLYSDSRLPTVTVHTDGSTVFADGPGSDVTGNLATGDFATPSEVHTVIQTALDQFDGSDKAGIVAVKDFGSAANPYQVDDLLNVYNFTWVVGESRERCSIERTDAGTADSGVIRMTSDNATNIRGILIQNINLRGAGTGAGTTIHGVDTDGNQAFGNTIDNCVLESLSGDGIRLPDSTGFSNDFLRISVDDTAGWGFQGHAGVVTNFKDWQQPCRPDTGHIWAKFGKARVVGCNLGNTGEGVRFGDSANTQSCDGTIRDTNFESISPGATAIDVQQSSRVNVDNVQLWVDANLSGSGTTIGIDPVARNNKVVLTQGLKFQEKNGSGLWDEKIGGSAFTDSGGLIDLSRAERQSPSSTGALNRMVAMNVQQAGFEAAFLNVITGGGGVGVDGTQRVGPNGVLARDIHFTGRRSSDPTTSDLNADEVMLFVSDGTPTGEANDLVYAVNDGGTIETAIIVDESADAA